MSGTWRFLIGLCERGRVPDPVVRLGIRLLLRRRLAEICAADSAGSPERERRFVAAMDAAPVALVPEVANDQHYEMPAGFFEHVLGGYRKYSSAYWDDDSPSLDQAEAAGLAATCEHAGLSDGQDVLELGCGWGSLTLWMAARYPASRIVAVSNSASQRSHIEREAARRGLANVRVLTADMNDFEIGERFDRVVSVEMFEHMRNWRLLFQRIADWLRPGGRFMLHVFVHRSEAYAFVPRDATDWLSRYFFSGGMMPSEDLALRFQDRLRLVSRWRWSGRHYAKTANAWLARMDAASTTLMPMLEDVYGRDHARLWYVRWRMFFMSVAEMFGYDQGRQWLVNHYLFELPAPPHAVPR